MTSGCTKIIIFEVKKDTMDANNFDDIVKSDIIDTNVLRKLYSFFIWRKLVLNTILNMCNIVIKVSKYDKI